MLDLPCFDLSTMCGTSEEEARFLFQGKPRWIPLLVVKECRRRWTVSWWHCALCCSQKGYMAYDCFSFPPRPGRVVIGAEQMFPARRAGARAPGQLIGVTL